MLSLIIFQMFLFIIYGLAHHQKFLKWFHLPQSNFISKCYLLIILFSRIKEWDQDCWNVQWGWIWHQTKYYWVTNLYFEILNVLIRKLSYLLYYWPPLPLLPCKNNKPGNRLSDLRIVKIISKTLRVKGHEGIW